MNAFARLRRLLFADDPERERMAAHIDIEAAVQNQRATELMTHWDQERAEDLRRINRTGDPVYGWLVPEARKESPRESS